ncbi:GMC family oxidoreductase [Mesorhizobium sp.]|uniref:GMC oxidoreductase n=1 Tax=Mesorhizobium sp. TaxID=1871066 RepID=UPI0025EFF41A|nr:GMC family oxidoreductase [Mesorhizobium sp.]
MNATSRPDVIIVGSGVGGGTTALRLAGHGLSVLMLERGDYLPKEDDNWSPQAVYIDRKYTARETWLDGADRSFHPSVFYNVGGATKFFGCTMIRFRERDFEDLEHHGGLSPSWPISYGDLEPYYEQAEHLFHTMGTQGIDPTEPRRANPFPYSGVRSDPPMEALSARLRAQGLRPFPQHAAIHMPPHGNCVRCGTCDGYPCRIGAKADAERSVVAPALASGRVTLRTGTVARRVLLSPDGKQVTGIEVEQGGHVEVLTAGIYVLAASAINSAAILLRSATDKAPRGAANSSDVVGRHYMAHNNTAMMAISTRRNPTVFQKTVTINDFYFGDDAFRYPMGCIMSLGKLKPGMMTAANPLVPKLVNRMLSDRSYDWWIMSEDLPDPGNRVSISGDTIKMDVRRNNLRAHTELTKRAARAMRRAGLPLTLTKLMPVATTSHQCGTVRFGNDPAKAALDPFCRTFDHSNLFVVDASFFPSSAAVNPALTIAAQALRVSDHIAAADFGISARTTNPLRKTNHV